MSNNADAINEALAKRMIGKCYEWVHPGSVRYSLVVSYRGNGWVQLVSVVDVGDMAIEVDSDHIEALADTDNWKEIPRANFDSLLGAIKTKIDEMLGSNG